MWKWSLGGSVVRVPIAARGFGALGYQAVSRPCCSVTPELWPRGRAPLGSPRGSFQGAAPGSVALSLVPPHPSPLGWGQCFWSFAQCGWRGSNPAPGTDGDGSPLTEGSPSAPRRGCCHWGWHSSEGAVTGVTWLWGDLALGVHIGPAAVCAGVSSVGTGGLGGGTAPGPRLRRAGRSGLPLGRFDSARLGHVSHAVHIWRFFQRQGEPDAPRRAALGWEQRGRESPGSTQGRLLHLGEPLCLCSWISHPGSPVPTGATSPGCPRVRGPPRPFPQHMQGPPGCWAGVSDPSAPQG